MIKGEVSMYTIYKCVCFLNNSLDLWLSFG
jgi:hypothetical protein